MAGGWQWGGRGMVVGWRGGVGVVGARRGGKGWVSGGVGGGEGKGGCYEKGGRYGGGVTGGVFRALLDILCHDLLHIDEILVQLIEIALGARVNIEPLRLLDEGVCAESQESCARVRAQTPHQQTTPHQETKKQLLARNRAWEQRMLLPRRSRQREIRRR